MIKKCFTMPSWIVKLTSKIDLLEVAMETLFLVMMGFMTFSSVLAAFREAGGW
ncbi:MAG TPA: hypothetical protein VNK49_08860 [Anaerolineales bacterium]|nr:hypothetical protein [Anaerolineales bacterium]